jgi:hypothetical protein
VTGRIVGRDLKRREDPPLLHLIACISLGIAFASAAAIVIDEIKHPQQMWVMNIVWPVTALYFSVIGVWFYFRAGRRMTREAMQGARGRTIHGMHGEHSPKTREQAPRSAGAPNPTFTEVAISASHCGAGCVVGDVIAEFAVFSLGLTMLGVALYASYAADFSLAWIFGIAFQYFVIKPMKHLTPGQGLIAAIKADTLTIIAFEVGMFAWMALVFFVLFPHPHLLPTEAVYWLMMQIAMVIGFVTSLPVNRWLLKAGLKEVMG